MKNILLIITLFITHVLYSQTYDIAEKFYSNGSPKVIKTYKETTVKLELIKKTTWYQDGYKKTVTFYKDGMFNGKSTAWHNNGQIEYEKNYKDGILNGKVTMWSESDSKLLEENYNNGVLQGKTTQWYKNGQKSYQGNYENAEQDGLWTAWYKNGQKEKEGTYKDGIQHGLWTRWYENGQKKSEETYKDDELISIKEWYEDGLERENVCISTEFGIMILKLYHPIAPKHVESFIQHVKNGYYNGTTFHRVIPGFVIQGGDPNTKDDDRSNDGKGGNAAKFYGEGEEENPETWTLPAEFNDRLHITGTLSMARSQAPNSAGSQFFICAGPVPQLDNKYTVFGQVVSGLEVIQQIVNVPRDSHDNPINKIVMDFYFCEKEVEEEE